MSYPGHDVGMASRRQTGAIRLLPSGKYQARILDPQADGKNKYVTLGTFAEKADADAAIRRALSAHERREWVRPEHGRTTVAVWAERWFATKQGKRPKTVAFYRMALDAWVLPHLGWMQLAQVDSSTLRAWLGQLEAKGLAPATVGHAYAVARQVFGSAVEARYIASTPAVLRGVGGGASSPATWPTAEEVFTLADEVGEEWRAIVLLAGLAGLRFGELAGLRRRDVDLMRRRVHVREQAVDVDGRIIVGPPKTAAGRRAVAMPAAAVDAMTVHLDRWAQPGAQGLVFPSPAGGHLGRSWFGAKVWRPARRRADLDEVKFHGLRHTAATLAAMTGATTKELMARLGQASPQAALRYQHVAQGRDEEIAAGIDALVARAATGTAGDVVALDASGTRMARRPLRRPGQPTG